MGNAKRGDFTDKELGMDREISRRDFLNGVALTIGAAMMPSPLHGMFPQMGADYYPPALNGLRGSHVGSFEVMHSVRDGTFWDDAGAATDTGERYDLIVVGGGISGLSAAHFFRKQKGGNVRVLIIENHDDFGGHAKRNEFHADRRTMLGFGGTFSIESPAPYSPVAKGLIEELGIDVPSYPKYVDKKLYRSHGMHQHIFFDKQQFGEDKLVINPDPRYGEESRGSGSVRAFRQFVKQAPMSAQAKKDLRRLYTDKKDYMPGLSDEEKKARLARMSYATYLTDVAKVSPELVKMFQAMPQPLFGVGIDAIAAQDAWGLDAPGFDCLKLNDTPGKGMNRDAIPNEEAEKYFFHFPDGNASIARMLVRKLIPDAIPGSTAQDIVLARADYSKLDREGAPVRIRLNSTAVKVQQIGDAGGAKEVEVQYSQGGKLYSARSAYCVLACWHVVIPYICGELPEKQKQALSSAAKVPLLYTNVAIRNWKAFEKLKTNGIYAPGMYHTFMALDIPVSIGGYECSKRPDEPIVVHMSKTPCHPGLPAREQHLRGRMELFMTTFQTMERKIREQFARIVGPGGFDPATDITAITVNRWPHGYAYEYNSLWDKFWLEGTETPCQVARKPYGRIAIANADADAYAYTDCAIDQAWRAVGELAKA
jgi:spermidine dehydrogenase